MVRVIFIVLLFPFKLLAQHPHEVHPTIIGARFDLLDFSSNKPLGTVSKMFPGVGFTFLKGMNGHLDWSVSLDGAFTDSALESRQAEKKLVLQGEFNLRARMFLPNRSFQPFISSGAGFSTYSGQLGGYLPVGLGIQYRLFPDAWTIINAQYRFVTPRGVLPHYFYSIGFYGTLVARRRTEAPKTAFKAIPLPIKASFDRDNDGIVDSVDHCPDQFGVLSANGCPDRDSDGITDINDKCPDIKGSLKYNGCPMPDADGDSISDDEDACPLIYGKLLYQGCPYSDRDKDGIKDEEDRCPDSPGTKQNDGCPEISNILKERVDQAARNILFYSGSYTLTTSSYKYLDEIAQIILKDTSIKVSIEGHTDSIGVAEENMLLSKNRAKTVYNYLLSKGISKSRLRFEGFGETIPKETNESTIGRRVNRRVEIKLYKEFKNS